MEDCSNTFFPEIKSLNNSYYFNKLYSLIIIVAPILQMSHIVRKPTICICKNKGADQLRSNCEADQRLCFCYNDT